jgi:hypothetical protein
VDHRDRSVQEDAQSQNSSETDSVEQQNTEEADITSVSGHAQTHERQNLQLESQNEPPTVGPDFIADHGDSVSHLPMLLPRRNIWPPPPPGTESEQERLDRVEAEREAKRVCIVLVMFMLSPSDVYHFQVSDAIDAALSLERKQRKRASNVKILLLGPCYFCLEASSIPNVPLGQAESGKSTILKNFQLHFAPNAFQAEVCPKFSKSKP